MTSVAVDAGDVVARVLGYRSVDELKQGGEDSAYRLAFLLNLPGSTLESLQVLRQVIYLVVEEAQVPSMRDTAELVEENDRVAGSATPMDDEMRSAAARGFGVADGVDSVEAVYQVCSRATTFLFKSLIVARGELDRNPLPGSSTI
jgi:hypothetical protein